MTDIKDRDVLREQYQNEFDRNLEAIENFKEKEGKVPSPTAVQEFKDTKEKKRAELNSLEEKNKRITETLENFSNLTGAGAPTIDMYDVFVPGGKSYTTEFASLGSLLRKMVIYFTLFDNPFEKI